MISKITLEQLIAGAILQFGTVDKTDIKILVEILNKKNIILNKNTEIKYIVGYIENKNNRYYLKDKYQLDSKISNDYSIKEELENIASPGLIEILKTISIKMITLNKIMMLDKPYVKDEKQLFSELQLEAIEDLKNDFYITTIWVGNSPFEEEQTYVLTKKGEVRLFMYNNKDIINNFRSALIPLRYDPELIEDFLMTIDLDKFAGELSDIIEFENFCKLYDRDINKARG